MPTLNISVEGYLIAVGDLGMGTQMLFPSTGRGITLETEYPGNDVVVSGLTKMQCNAAGNYIRQRVKITITTEPAPDTSTGST